MTDLLFHNEEELNKTLVIGLYHRFKKDKDESEHEEYKHENPYDFESFVARTLENQYGGRATVTRKSGDGGIDIVHVRPEGLFLGQVKCELNNVSYIPAAVLHSQMVKQGAAGGYVISIRDFEQSTLEYVKDLNIQLINGKELVHLWLNPQPAYKKSYLEELLQAIEVKVREFFFGMAKTVVTYLKELVPTNLGKDKIK